jgi:hypothetical protein
MQLISYVRISINQTDISNDPSGNFDMEGTTSISLSLLMSDLIFRLPNYLIALFPFGFVLIAATIISYMSVQKDSYLEPISQSGATLLSQ